MEQLQEALGIILRDNRKALGITQTELAKRVDLHRTYMSEIEAGKRNITLASLYRVAKALGTTGSSLLATAEGQAGGHCGT